MTKFQQLQDAAAMTNNQVAEHFEVTLRTVFRWRSGESQPSAVGMRMTGSLATAQVNKDFLEVSMSNRKVVITNGDDEEVKTVEIKNNEVDKTLDDSDGCVLAKLGGSDEQQTS